MICHHRYRPVVYPDIGSDTVLVGVPAADDPGSLQALGPAFLGPKALRNIVPVDKMKPFCGRLGYPFKYLAGR